MSLEEKTQGKKNNTVIIKKQLALKIINSLTFSQFYIDKALDARRNLSYKMTVMNCGKHSQTLKHLEIKSV